MKRVKVKVTQAHINEGKKHEPSSCPIALAITDATGEQWCAGTTYVRRCTQQLELGIRLPPSVMAFIETFDLGQPVKPFAFTLEVPS